MHVDTTPDQGNTQLTQDLQYRELPWPRPPGQQPWLYGREQKMGGQSGRLVHRQDWRGFPRRVRGEEALPSGPSRQLLLQA